MQQHQQSNNGRWKRIFLQRSHLSMSLCEFCIASTINRFHISVVTVQSQNFLCHVTVSLLRVGTFCYVLLRLFNILWWTERGHKINLLFTWTFSINYHGNFSYPFLVWCPHSSFIKNEFWNELYNGHDVL